MLPVVIAKELLQGYFSILYRSLVHYKENARRRGVAGKPL